MSKDKQLDTIATGGLRRRWKIASAGMAASSRLAAGYATSWWLPEDQRQNKQRALVSREAEFLAAELGKLKGSVVKVGQMVAVYGQHFLPPEVTDAFHALESDTTALRWSVVKQYLRDEIGSDKLHELEIEHTPVGAASLSQVHRATRIADSSTLVLKVQYPGIATAIDNDINDVARLLRMAGFLTGSKRGQGWLEDVRDLLHREVNYHLEVNALHRMRAHLVDDQRFIVPTVIDDYCSTHVLAMSYEPGVPFNHPKVAALSLVRRNKIAQAILELFFREVFVWGELQTDPNFGNYLLRIDERGQDDRIVLLDFGAVRRFPPEFIAPLRDMIRAGLRGDRNAMIAGAVAFGFIAVDDPQEAQTSFADVCLGLIEPLTAVRGQPALYGEVPDQLWNAQGEYRWHAADLPARMTKQAARSACSRYFKMPPGDFVLLARKLGGVYTMLAVLGAEFNGRSLVEPYLD